MSHTRTLGLVLLLCAVGAWCRPVARSAEQPVEEQDGYSNGTLPVVFWHGMGDFCCSQYSMGLLKKRIQDVLPGTFVYSVALADGEEADIQASFFGNVNQQVAEVCQKIAAEPRLAGGYNAVGYSQGGEFLRAVVERCQHTGPRVHSLITLGSQHQGIMNIPECWSPSYNVTPTLLCGAVQALLGLGAYLPFIRDHVVQAQYFKDPYNLEKYLAYNPFLPDINNEGTVKNQQYKENFASLERLVLYRFDRDVTVVPSESSWFGFYDGTKLLSMEQTPLYQEDTIGLRTLDERGAVTMGNIPGAHMQFSVTWFENHIIWPYLAPAHLRRDPPVDEESVPEVQQPIPVSMDAKAVGWSILQWASRWAVLL